MGVVGSTLASASVLVAMCVSAAWAGTVKPLPAANSDEIEQPPAVLAANAARGDAGFVLLNLTGRLVKWGSGGFGAGAVVRYAFVNAETPRADSINCQTMVPIGDKLPNSGLRQADFVRAVRQAMDDWSAVANIEFRPADDPATADLLIGGEKEPRGIAYADVERKTEGVSGGVAPIARAAMCFNLDLAWENNFDGDSTTPNVRYVAAHELGHTLGLDHAWGEDKIMRFQYAERFYVPQKPDIAGAAFLYGARPYASGLALVRTPTLTR